MVKKILTIAGSDAGGGAGIQADLKTFEEFNLFGISTITGILSVDPTTNQHELFQIPLDVISNQLTTALSGRDIRVIKTGLLGLPELIDLIVKNIERLPHLQLVVDPVAAVKSTQNLLQRSLLTRMIKQLFPLATIVTPNLLEAELLANQRIETIEEMKEAAKIIHELGPKAVVIKGGTRLSGEEALDLLFDGKQFILFHSPKLSVETNHGAGCSFSAAIAANLANNNDLITSVKVAKEFVHAAINEGVYLNKKTGYVWHGAYRHSLKGGVTYDIISS
ncbi:bifunctional hydroxymethylpyrimidine kinase/phosphomethylpyrimidine kinase [Vagococcus xieshaowenii]|uniref:pyridoxal kinase n=1 Tax=Vagococcus xieshaowenii TaxID=2562451 RepID=A0AAJ5EEW8_9ENTE|nr:bifunctional hydroxymethylpyrimidine kinase/phosphomethylpyrimidine kinase [Vagococcus xieshaowenii]QCA28325.1 bifunctional hydroxymethylpyrimidine kinase/phosphomethylpyrimidine kinase [Vagococcus xieshaowenii]TFZ42287.1 bifunctional hydroxymethylpyrimidine kinase/phosphomethylpyrimidine kinase [Vagococcus xieshaowenii]